MRFTIDSDIHQSSTLPGSFYRDPALYQRLLERAFAPSWQWVGHHENLASGHGSPFELLPGSINEPLLLVRDERDQLRCLSNVCTHRGCLLLESPCVLKSIRCGYHGRTFGLDGHMQHMPAFTAAKDFPRQEDDLPELPLHSICGAPFTSLGQELKFAEWAAPLAPLLERLPQEQFVPDPEGAATYEVESHWALYLDNFLEGFHIPYVHPALHRTMLDEEYETQLFPSGSLQVGIAREGETAFDPEHTLPGLKGPVAAYYYWLSPGTLFNFYPWGLSLNVIEPLGPKRTRVRFFPYVWRPELRDSGAGSGLDGVQEEDAGVVQKVQRGVNSRLYTCGRFSPEKEQGVHHFHRMLAQWLEI
ncbi:MAG: choline monooxygenase [Candidatus Paceibacteria bacterium]|jgi:choline monooxygenase